MKHSDDDLKLCAWFALCTNVATETMDHPILGGVPTCQRCADKVRTIDAKARKK